MFLYDYALSATTILDTYICSYEANKLHTVFERHIDAINAVSLAKIVLRHVWYYAPRRVADESGCEYRLAPRDSYAAESRCQRARRLEQGELEHLRRQLTKLMLRHVGHLDRDDHV